MNFLKKKIKNVVHGKRNKDDDDDDFDNYVPEVPPHPSTLSENGASLAATSENFFPSFQSTLSSISSAADSATKSLAGLTSVLKDPLQDQDNKDKPDLSLDELKAKEEEHKREEKEKLKQQEESKKDNEEWKYFLSLTAKVEAVTSKTQSALTKLKDESAVKDINKIEEDLCYADKYDVRAPKVAGGWIAFEEQQEFNPADPIFNPQPQEVSPKEESPPPPVLPDEGTQKLARELIDDFGFTFAPGVPSLPAFEASTQEPEIDPFDTSFIDIEAIKSGKALKPTELLHDLDFTQTELDPFDTSHVETAFTQELVVTESEVDVK